MNCYQHTGGYNELLVRCNMKYMPKGNHDMFYRLELKLRFDRKEDRRSLVRRVLSASRGEF
jgi:hypothetical protein